MKKRHLSIVAGSVALALQAGCSDTADVDATATSTPRNSCADMANTALAADTRIDSTFVAARDGLPGYCEIQGRINERTGAGPNDTTAPYYIGFLLRMPTNWNHRFYFEGGAGTDGNQILDNPVGDRASGDRNALQRGFAVVATNGGHPQNDTSFGFDNQARIDYGYNAVAQVTPTAQTLVTRYYGEQSRYAYFVGCSNGGRQAMQASQRNPEYFDGIVAGDPGWNLTDAAVDEAWNTQQFARISAQDPDTGAPRLWTSFPVDSGELNAVSSAILEYCDAADGIADGMVNDPEACAGFDVNSVDALSSGQKNALQAFHEGPPNDLYSTFPWDPGIRGAGWRQWTIGVPGFNGINAVLGSSALAQVFTTPAVDADPLAYVLAYDFDTDPQRTAAAARLINADSTDLGAFDRAGGKLLIYQGRADPVFSAHAIMAYYDSLRDSGGGIDRVNDYARLFLIPGMNHCSGGPATDQFDMLTAIQNWVENSQPPKRVRATVDPANPGVPENWQNRSRPLCPYPEFAAYTGKGDINSAASFVCKTPG